MTGWRDRCPVANGNKLILRDKQLKQLFRLCHIAASNPENRVIGT